MTENELLKYALKNGMLDLHSIQSDIEMKKREEYLSKHNYKIWQGKDEKWYTYLPDEEKVRILKKRSSESEIQDVIVEYWKAIESEPYFDTVFNEWIENKLRYDEICRQSYDRYKTDYLRFFTNNENAETILSTKFKNIDSEILERFIKSTIADKKLTRKSYNGMKLIINGVFRYGKKYTDFSITNFMGDFELSRRSFTRKQMVKDEEIFSEDEILLITKKLSENGDIFCLGLLLTFETGLRVGELSSLKKSDIGKNSIHVQRTEIKYKSAETGKNVCEVQNFPKSDAGNRYLIINKKAKDTLQKIVDLNPYGEFLFMRSGKRIRSNAFRKKLSSECDKLGLKHRTTHKIRKTYATMLIDAKVDESLVAEQLGHEDIATTKKYYYLCNQSEKHKIEQISSAILF